MFAVYEIKYLSRLNIRLRLGTLFNSRPVVCFFPKGSRQNFTHSNIAIKSNERQIDLKPAETRY